LFYDSFICQICQQITHIQIEFNLFTVKVLKMNSKTNNLEIILICEMIARRFICKY
jgi:hypothetical protein